MNEIHISHEAISWKIASSPSGTKRGAVRQVFEPRNPPLADILTLCEQAHELLDLITHLAEMQQEGIRCPHCEERLVHDEDCPVGRAQDLRPVLLRAAIAQDRHQLRIIVEGA